MSLTWGDLASRLKGRRGVGRRRGARSQQRPYERRASGKVDRLARKGPNERRATDRVSRNGQAPDVHCANGAAAGTAGRITDRRVLALIRRYLEAGMMANGLVHERTEGTPQGGPLSPLLANVLLDEVDRELERRGHCFVRYADDCNVYVQSKRAGERVMQALEGLYAKLQLRINPAKSAVARAWTRSFLGFSFWVAPGRGIKRRVAPKALKAMQDRVRQITARTGGRSLRQVIAELRSYLMGWRAYFRLADTPGIFAAVAKWLHRRLRALVLKQWKRGPTIYRELQRRGVDGAALGMAARFGRSWWHVAGHVALHIALPSASFESLGLPRLAAR